MNHFPRFVDIENAPVTGCEAPLSRRDDAIEAADVADFDADEPQGGLVLVAEL